MNPAFRSILTRIGNEKAKMKDKDDEVFEMKRRINELDELKKLRGRSQSLLDCSYGN